MKRIAITLSVLAIVLAVNLFAMEMRPTSQKIYNVDPKRRAMRNADNYKKQLDAARDADYLDNDTLNYGLLAKKALIQNQCGEMYIEVQTKELDIRSRIDARRK